MLVELLSFFAVTSALATAVALIPRLPAAPLPLGIPTSLMVIAAGATLTAVIVGDPPGAIILGGVGLLVWLAMWPVLPRWGALAILVFASLLGAATTYIVYAAVQTVLQAVSPVVVVLSVVLLLLEIAALLLTLSYAFEILDILGRRDTAAPPVQTITDAELPHVALQVPCYNEPVEIVQQTLEALARVEYPHLLVQVVDNNTKDPALWRPLEQLCRDLGPRFSFLHLEDWPGFKAGALNEATKRLSTEYDVIGIVDADYIVDPGFLRATAAHFHDPHVAFVQSAQHYRDWEDDRYLRGLFYSFRYFFDVTLPARTRRNAIIFCGTMGLIRRQALEGIGGWAEDCITEDSEASLRMLGTGTAVGVYDPRPWGSGLMPLSFQGLKQQRFRWALGGIQILRRHWRELVPFGRHRLRLTRPQRLHYLLGSTQWFGDLLTVLFTTLLILTAITTAFHHRLPVRQLTGAVLVIPVLFLATGLMRALWALRRTTDCTWGDAWRALRVWFALSWVVSLACMRGLIRYQASFLRTPKSKEGAGTLRRALRYSLPETFIAGVAVISALAMLIGSISVATVALGILLVFEAVVYASAPWASAAAEGIQLTPFRRIYMRSAQNTGERPVRRGAAAAAATGGVLAAAAVAIAALVITSPSDNAPFTHPSDLPPLGRISQVQQSTPSPTPTPTSASSASPSTAATPTETPASSPTSSPAGGGPTVAP